MKILIVAYDAHPCEGGVDTYIQTLKSGLEKKGHLVDLVSYTDVKKLNQEDIKRIVEYQNALNSEFKGKVPEHVIRTEVKRFIHKQILNSVNSTYDIIHSQIGLLNSVIKEVFPNIPLVGTIHGCIYSETLMWEKNRKNAEFYKEYDDEAVNIPDKIITVSSYLDKNLPLIAPEKRLVIHNGINVSDFQVKQKNNQIIKIATTGNLYHLKGYDILLQALIALKKENLLYELTMFGDGSERDKLEQIVKMHQLPVKFKGHVPREVLQEELPKFDVFVQPSRFENFPFSVIEAMASGCAIICSKVNGMNEQVQHLKNGILFEPENSDQLSECLQYMIRNREETKRMGIQGRKDAEEKFSIDIMVEKHEEVYRQVAAIYSTTNNTSDGLCENKGLVNQNHWDTLYENLDIYKPAENDPFRVWINEHIPMGKGKSCIEIGCFPGRFLTIFGDAGYTLNGIDLTPKVESMPFYLSSLGYSIGQFKKQDFFSLDYSTTKHDIVCSFGFIEHFSNWLDVLLKHSEMVKENGYLVIEVPNFSGFPLRAMRMFLDFKNYEGHNTASMYPEVWEKILSLLDFEICFSGYFGEFDFWIDEIPDSLTKQKLISLIMESKPFFDSIDLPDCHIKPYCGLIAKKKTSKSVSAILTNKSIQETINNIVKKATREDQIKDLNIRKIYSFFELWCKYMDDKKVGRNL
ncbi:glycosyltransferase [Bacillus cytotoxicus]|uniref:Lipopolysaccharide biosynthesis n=1 Tax=Bacillus cytotoxicus TaxID=580165 RepID=A0AAX2CF45_9BACI|nr:glycosyltransferase [Bacillus cytotoxicus]QTR82618.1 glycosyltransferase [Bacillus cytotoxicus]QTR86356.1 glycosyltransferase [Bacillus cytotoxicus]SCL89319.1 Lipopolysaccharide biosynthesis [Bacillus cytotoxicus]